jgi:undecaprenyl-diphosphatase
MNKLFDIFRNRYFTAYYLVPLLLIWSLGALFLLLNGYEQSFLKLNVLHQNWLDLPMMMLTMFADAGFISVLLIFLLIKKHPYQLIMLLITVILSGIIAQLLKNFVFNDWDRPPYLLKEQVYTVGKYVLNHRSFPSGHSTTVAAIFTMLAYFRKQFRWEVLMYAIICPTIAFTRIYLGVHFLGDVVAGLALGLFCSVILLWLIKPFEIKSKPWLYITLKIASVVAAAIILAAFFGKYL